MRGIKKENQPILKEGECRNSLDQGRGMWRARLFRGNGPPKKIGAGMRTKKQRGRVKSAWGGKDKQSRRRGV